jgi:hypothetical protein
LKSFGKFWTAPIVPVSKYWLRDTSKKWRMWDQLREVEGKPLQTVCHKNDSINGFGEPADAQLDLIGIGEKKGGRRIFTMLRPTQRLPKSVLGQPSRDGAVTDMSCYCISTIAYASHEGCCEIPHN